MHVSVTWLLISDITCYSYMYFSTTFLGIRPSLRNSIAKFNECGCCMREAETNRRAGTEYAASVLCHNQKGDVHTTCPRKTWLRVLQTGRDRPARQALCTANALYLASQSVFSVETGKLHMETGSSVLYPKLPCNPLVHKWMRENKVALLRCCF